MKDRTEYQRQYYKKYRLLNKEKERSRVEAWKKCHKKHVSEYTKEYCKLWYAEEDNILERVSKFHLHQEKRSPYNETKRNRYEKDKKANDIGYRIRCNLSRRICNAVVNKSNSSKILMGCSINDFLKHIELKFQNGMNWNNYGVWVLDHIVPCKIFDLTKSESQLKCFNWRNIRPMWMIDNCSKNASFSEDNVEQQKIISELKINNDDLKQKFRFS